MGTLRVVVASNIGAKLFDRKRFDEPLRLVLEIPHPKGRLLNQELISDRPGRSDDPRGVASHAFSTELSPKEQELRMFAKDVVSVIERHAQLDEFDKMVLIAEPKLLGVLRGEMSKRLVELIEETIAKDLWRDTEEMLTERVSKIKC